MRANKLGDITALELMRALLLMDLPKDQYDKYSDYLMNNPILAEHEHDLEAFVQDFVRNTTFVRIVFVADDSSSYEIFVPLTKEQLEQRVSDYASKCISEMNDLRELEGIHIDEISTDTVVELLGNRVPVEGWLDSIGAMDTVRYIANDVTVEEITEEWPVEFLELLVNEIKSQTKIIVELSDCNKA